MAARWSNESTVAEYRDLQASSMALDSTGNYALLGGRKALALIDLANPKQSRLRVNRQSKWEVNTISWNPHPQSSHVFATACNQRVDIWYTESDTITVNESLKSHTRVVSDLDWCPVNNNQIVTCSVDTFTYLWDLREPRKPAFTYSSVAGASQVQWNKVNPLYMATTHDGNIRIWDRRSTKAPIHYISGHLSKIHGLDWAPNSENTLVTSSQDYSVKFWEIESHECFKKFTSTAPVWRARYTPFGDGVMTVVVPQVMRGENSLFLWNHNNLDAPVHTFVGHTDVVLEFQWRKLGPSSQDYQLITWSKDQSLRLWKIDQQLQKSCGQDIADISLEITAAEETEVASTVGMGGGGASTASHSPTHTTHSGVSSTGGDATSGGGGGGVAGAVASGGDVVVAETSGVVGSPPSHPIPPNISSTPRRKDNRQSLESNGSTKTNISTYSSTPPIREEFMKPNVNSRPQMTLKQEFELGNFDFPGLRVVEKDARNRVFRVVYTRPPYAVHLVITFHENYPYGQAPVFHLNNFPGFVEIEEDMLEKLTTGLEEIAEKKIRYNMICLQAVLRQLTVSTDRLVNESKSPEKDGHGDRISYLTHTNSTHTLPMYNMYSLAPDDVVPYPRTSGARFCGAGILVCFTRPAKRNSQRVSMAADFTPRALSDMNPYTLGSLQSTYMAHSPPTDVMNYYFEETKRPLRHRKSKSRLRDETRGSSRDNLNSPAKKSQKGGPVIIYDISALLPVHKKLAENYVVDNTDLPEMCSKNAAAAATVGRKDLEKTWMMIAETSRLAGDVTSPDESPPWAHHPFGRPLIKSLLDYYSSIHDVQSLAMICCALGEKNQSTEPKTPSPTHDYTPPSYNAYHTIHPSDTTLKGWSFTVPKQRKYSLTDECLDYSSCVNNDEERHSYNQKLLSPNGKTLYNNYKNVYANLLYIWGLLDKRAEVLKYVSVPKEQHKGLEIKTVCRKCNGVSNEPVCHTCKCYSVLCIICHIPVKGASMFCLYCGHGGHARHIQSWFATHTVCPTGCGCHCMDEHHQSGNSRPSSATTQGSSVASVGNTDNSR